MTLILTGSRSYSDKAKVSRVLTNLKPTKIYVGCANGLDRLVREWATLNGVELHVFKADWATYGRRAGPLRNAKMVEVAGMDAVCIAFPGGAGTESCKEIARRKGIKIYCIQS